MTGSYTYTDINTYTYIHTFRIFSHTVAEQIWISEKRTSKSNLQIVSFVTHILQKTNNHRHLAILLGENFVTNLFLLIQCFRRSISEKTLERMSGLFGSFSTLPSTGETRGTKQSNIEVL